MKEKYLIMVEGCDNHNKFYRMVPNDDGCTWTAVYGRVGTNGVKRSYHMSQWDSKYDEKVRKGYKDMTNFHMVAGNSTISSQFDPIPDAVIRKVVDNLLKWADEVIKGNYTVSAESVNKDAIRNAQKLINSLSDIYTTSCNKNGIADTTVYRFNRVLEELFVRIPRRMSDVDEFKAKTVRDFKEIIEREQRLLDVMSSRVNSFTGDDDDDNASAATSTNGKTILDAVGLEIRRCDDKEKNMIKSHLDADTQRLFKDCYHVVNKRTREKFDNYVKTNKIKNVRYYYHGSRNENYWSILKQGLKLRPSQRVTRAGAMFGYGLYFAPKAKKSCGYTSLPFAYWSNRTGSNQGSNHTAMLTVFKVAMGKKYDLQAYSPIVSKWNEKDCKKAGYDSVYAHAGVSLQNDEAIVYNEDACTISYLIELCA